MDEKEFLEECGCNDLLFKKYAKVQCDKIDKEILINVLDAVETNIKFDWFDELKKIEGCECIVILKLEVYEKDRETE